MGTNGRQWDTMHFHGLTKPFQGADFRGFPAIGRVQQRRPDGVPGHAIIRRSDFGGFVAWTRWFWGHLRPPRRSGGNGGENGPWLKKMGKKCQTVCKPGSVHPSPIKGRGWMAIHLGRPLPDASRDLPGRRRENPPAGPHINEVRRVAPIWSCSRWGLPCRLRCRRRGALLPHPFTLAAGRSPLGGLLSVALSLGSPPPAVNRHRVSVEPGLSSPCGFPRCKRRPSDRLAGLNLIPRKTASSVAKP